jgi:hypothetical protein
MKSGLEINEEVLRQEQLFGNIFRVRYRKEYNSGWGCNEHTWLLDYLVRDRNTPHTIEWITISKRERFPRSYSEGFVYPNSELLSMKLLPFSGLFILFSCWGYREQNWSTKTINIIFDDVENENKNSSNSQGEYLYKVDTDGKQALLQKIVHHVEMDILNGKTNREFL